MKNQKKELKKISLSKEIIVKLNSIQLYNIKGGGLSLTKSSSESNNSSIGGGIASTPLATCG